MSAGRWTTRAAIGCLIMLELAAAPHAAAAAGMVGSIDEADRIELRGHVPSAVRDSQDLGEVDPRARADRVIMVLRGSADQDADLKQLLIDLQTRGRAEYHRWLTPAAFAQRFGVAPADLSKLRAWLQFKGFKVDEEVAGGRSIVFSGSIGQLNDAFATRIHQYRWHGEPHVANATNPSIPRAFAGIVASFASLNDFRRAPQLIRATARPQLTSGSNHYLAPADFATIYDLTSAYAQGLTGSGRSIAVLGRSDVVAADLSNFRASFGLSSSTPLVVVNGPDPGLVHMDEAESDLDLEWAGAVAPSAAILFVTSKSTSMSDGIDLSSQYAVNHNIADVISLSYGSCESTGDVAGGNTLYNELWEQAAAQGTSVFVSSGDSGAAGCDSPTSTTATHGLGVNLLCSSPYSTCVGGSEFSADVSAPNVYWSASNAPATQGSALSYISEAVWNQSGTDLDASGGGASIYYAKPYWQLSPGVPSDGSRDVPDIAFSASSAHDPYLVYTSDGFSSSTLVGFGGTSAATPSMAGVAAVVAQRQNGRVGSFNPVLYGLSSLQSSSGAQVFHLITNGNNSVPGQAGFAASSGDPTYNQATGLGSLDGAVLIAHWNDYAGPLLGLSPTTAVVPANAVIGSATLTLPSATSWSAAIGGGATSWLSVTPLSGKGSAPLTYSATANVGSSRSGTIVAAGQVLTITQAAGSGSSGQLSLSASALSFGNDPLGAPSATQSVLVSNIGTAAVSLATIAVVGASAGDFSDVGSCVAGLALGPGASCFLNVAFDPTALGSRTASLQIGIGGAPMTVSLTGTGNSTPSSSDAPVPLWAYPFLSVLLIGIGVRRSPNTVPRPPSMSHIAAGRGTGVVLTLKVRKLL